MNLCKRLYYFVLCVFSLVLVISCSETLQTSHQQSQETYQSPNGSGSVKPRLFGLWSSPDLISNHAAPAPGYGAAASAVSSLANANNGFISWRVDAEAGQLGATETFSKNVDGVWISNSPTSLATDPAIVVDKQIPVTSVNSLSGEAVAAWVENGFVYTSFFTPDFGWGQTVLQGQGDNIQLSANISNQVLMLWRSFDQSNTVLNARYFDFSFGWGQQFALVRNASITKTATSPVRLSNGSYLFSWVEESAGIAALKSARLDTNLGWTSPRSIMNGNVSDISRIDLVASAGLTKLFYQKNISFNANEVVREIFSVDYQFNLGFDESWGASDRFVGTNQTSDSSAIYEFKLIHSEGNGSSVNTGIAALWISDLDDGANQYQAVKFSQFDIEAGWSDPVVIATPLYRYSLLSPPPAENSNRVYSLRGTLSSTGNVHASWIELTSSSQQIRTVNTGVNQQWGSVEIVSIASATNVALQDLNLVSNVYGDAQIVWIEENKNANETQFNLFTSAKAGVNRTDPSMPPPPSSPLDPAQPKPDFHIPSSDFCSACHFPDGSMLVDHAEVIGSCGSCHNGTIATGKVSTHIATSDMCDACHGVFGWIPVITVDHTELIGTCESCHNGILASGKTATHIIATDVCEACHSAVIWVPVISVDHSQVLGGCQSCHNGIVASGKSLLHIPTTDLCDACHSHTVWIPVAVDHNEVLGTCESCHSSPLTHVNVGVTNGCDGCHSTATWLSPTNPLPLVSVPALVAVSN